MASLTRDLTRPRHILMTLLVALLTGGAGILGVAVAEDDPSAAPTFAIAFPHVGDRGRYDFSIVPAPEVSARYGEGVLPHAHRITFAWGAATEILNATGHWERAHPLEVSRALGEGFDNQTRWVRAGTGVALRTDSSNLAIGARGADAFPLSLLQDPYSEGAASSRHFRDEHASWSVPCIRNSLQGKTVLLGERSGETYSCLPGRGPDGIVHHVKALYEDAAGPLLMTTVHVDGFDLPDARLWWRPDIPYPVRIEDPTHNGTGAYHTWTLTQFDRGDAPLADDAHVDRPVVAMVQAAPRSGPVLMSEAGIDPAFSLSAAFAAGRDHPEESLVRDFLAQHPDAYIAIASSGFRSWPDAKMWHWDMVLTDAKEALHVGVARFDRFASVAGMEVPGTRTSQIFVQEQDPVETTYGGPPDLLFYRPSELPQLPPVQGALRLWSVYSGSAAPSDPSWQYAVMRDDGHGRNTSMVTAAAGLHVTTAGGPVYGPGALGGDDHVAFDMVRWYNDWSRVSGHTVFNVTWGDAFGDALAAAPPSDGGEPILQSVPAAEGLSIRQATAITFGAGFLALLYYFWPLLKFGPAGLFSRVRRERLLEHAVRQQIHDLVEAEPGIHQEEMLRRIARGRGNVDHHVRKMIDAGLLVQRRAGGYVCYFVKGAADRRLVDAAFATRSTGARDLLALVQRRPGIGLSEAARELGIRPSAVHHHVTRMVQAGLLQDHRVGKARRLVATPLAAQAIRPSPGTAA